MFSKCKTLIFASIPVILITARIIYNCFRPAIQTRDIILSDIISRRTINKSVHILCRYATIFAGKNPIVIISESNGAIDYAEFMHSLPKIYDVYCIELSFFEYNNNPKIVFDIMMELHPLIAARFILIGHSTSAHLLARAIFDNHIPAQNVDHLILSGLKDVKPFFKIKDIIHLFNKTPYINPPNSIKQVLQTISLDIKITLAYGVKNENENRYGMLLCEDSNNRIQHYTMNYTNHWTAKETITHFLNILDDDF